MHMRDARTILFASPLLLSLFSLFSLSACMVGKATYEDEVRARQECQSALKQCRQKGRSLEADLEDLHERVAAEVETNATLLEELATLQAERSIRAVGISTPSIFNVSTFRPSSDLRDRIMRHS